MRCNEPSGAGSNGVTETGPRPAPNCQPVQPGYSKVATQAWAFPRFAGRFPHPTPRSPPIPGLPGPSGQNPVADALATRQSRHSHSFRYRPTAADPSSGESGCTCKLSATNHRSTTRCAAPGARQSPSPSGSGSGSGSPRRPEAGPSRSTRESHGLLAPWQPIHRCRNFLHVNREPLSSVRGPR